jgi:hypothetical protein
MLLQYAVQSSHHITERTTIWPLSVHEIHFCLCLKIPRQIVTHCATLTANFCSHLASFSSRIYDNLISVVISHIAHWPHVRCSFLNLINLQEQ